MTRRRSSLLIGGILVLVAIGFATLFSNLNRVLAAVIERNGSEATGTKVAVNGVNVSLRQGTGEIQGLRVESPSGYEARDSFRLDGIRLDLDLGSLGNETLVIERIEVSAPVVFAEFRKDGSSNVGELRKRLERFAPASDAKSGAGSKAAEGKRIRIDEFVFAAGEITVDASELGIEPRTVKLPSIRLRSLGGPQGATPPELTKEILTQLIGRVTAELGRSELDRQLRNALGDTVDQAKGFLDKLKN